MAKNNIPTKTSEQMPTRRSPMPPIPYLCNFALSSPALQVISAKLRTNRDMTHGKIAWNLPFINFKRFCHTISVSVYSMSTRLCKPLCRSIRRSVGPLVSWSVSRLVCHTLLFFHKVAYGVACAQLMAIGLV